MPIRGERTQIRKCECEEPLRPGVTLVTNKYVCVNESL